MYLKYIILKTVSRALPRSKVHDTKSLKKFLKHFIVVFSLIPVVGDIATPCVQRKGWVTC